MQFENIVIQGEVQGHHESFPIPEIKKDMHCILEVISNKFHYIIVAQNGSYKIESKDYQISGDIHPPMKMIREYSNIRFHLKFEDIPPASYLPLQSMTIDSISHDESMRFEFHNLLIHFDQKSPVLSMLNHRGSCSFTYPNNHSGIVTIFRCVKFIKPDKGLDVIKYYGIPETGIRGRSRNHHGVRNSDVTNQIDYGNQFHSIENEIEDKIVFNSTEEKESPRWNVSIEENIKIIRYKVPKENLICYLEDRPRRKYPFGNFEISRTYADKKTEVRFLYTLGEKVDKKIRPFVCPISGHKGFAMMLGTTIRKFQTFSKFIKTLTKWTHPCQGTAKFKIFEGKSPEISFVFNYNPLDKQKGKIILSIKDIHGFLVNTYTCSVAHIVGVFSSKSTMSSEYNIQNQKEWIERYHCPHSDNCPRNCAGYIPSQDGITRVAIPKSIHCTCVSEEGIIPICSKYHYYVELCKEIPIQMGGFFTSMVFDYRANPYMYEKSEIRKILDGSHDIIYYIETFLYGVKL